MPNKWVTILLLPNRLDIVAGRGREIIGRRRIDESLDFEPALWSRDVGRLGETLGREIKAMGVTGAPTRVFYRSHTQSLETVALPAGAGGDSLQAARMANLESVAYSAESAVSEAMVVGRDRTTEGRRVHLVGAADRNDVTEAIATMIADAGLKLASSTPLDAVVVASMMREALHATTRARAWLHIGEYSGFFCASCNGVIQFSRPVSVGIDAMIRGLSMPFRIPGRAEQIALDSETARAILYRFGLPDRDDVVHEELQLRGGEIMPLLQPVVQRLLVELRQSLRFGLNDSDREAMSITITGPGSTLPSLDSILAGELGMAVEVDADDAGYDDALPCCVGSEMARAMRHKDVALALNLLPPRESTVRATRRLQRWLWTGAAAAMGLVVFDGLQLNARLNAAGQMASDLGVQSSALEALARTQGKFNSLQGALNDVKATINEALPGTVDYQAALFELSRLTPDSIRLTSIEFRGVETAMIGNLQGFVIPRTGELDDGVLTAFLDQLDASPLFDDLSLQNVQTASLRGTQGQLFEIDYRCVAWPAGGDLADLASAKTEEQQ